MLQKKKATKQKSESSQAETPNDDSTARSSTMSSKLEVAAASIVQLTQVYKQISASSTQQKKVTDEEYEEGRKAHVREKNLEHQRRLKGLPPNPVRDVINLPIPQISPKLEKSGGRRTKKEKLMLKSYKEFIELYKLANELNEEPESILRRTNGPDVKPFEIDWDEENGRGDVCLNGEKCPLHMLESLRLRENPNFFYFLVETYAECGLSLVEVMRRYIKTYGALPALSEY